MEKHEDYYARLREKYTDEELAEDFVFPHGLTPEEKAAVDAEMAALRAEQLAREGEAGRLYRELMRLHFLIKRYLEKEDYQPEYSFGAYLRDYIHALKKTQTAFAEDIGIHPSRLSRLLHDREAPGTDLVFRLEKHSGGLIPAEYWWRLHAKKQEFNIRHDEALRAREGAKVRNAVNLPQRH